MNEENEDNEPSNLNRLKSYSEEDMLQYAPTLQIGNYRQYDNNLFDRLEKEELIDNKVNDKSNFTNTKNVFFHLMNAHFRAIGHPSKYYTYKRQALLHSQNILKADRWNI